MVFARVILFLLLTAPAMAQIINPGGGSGTFNTLTGDATSTSTGGATSVVGLKGALLPSLAAGYLHYTGSAWDFASPSASVSSSANVYSANSQVQIDSVVSTAQNGLDIFGDSFTQNGAGATTAYPDIIKTDLNITSGFNNYGASGDTASDLSYHVFNSIAPATTGNPIVTMQVGRNDIFYNCVSTCPSTVTGYKAFYSAALYWAAMSSANNIPVSSMTQSGTWSSDTTFSQASGLTSTAAGNLSETCYVGPSGVVAQLYKASSTAGAYTFQIDNVTQTDTITGTSTIAVNTTWADDPGHNQSVSVALARFAGISQGSHTCKVTWVSGSVTVLPTLIPPTRRYRGLSSPRVFMTSVFPEQADATAATDAQFNTAAFALSQTAVTDGLYTPILDAVNAIDNVGDFVGGTSLPIHPAQAGYTHIAQSFESLINADRLVTAGGGANGTYYQNSGYSTTGVTSPSISANGTYCAGFGVPNALSVGHIVVGVVTADNTNNSDIGIYNSSGTLVAHIGAQHLGTTGNQTLAFAGGTQVIPTGKLYYCVTSVGTALQLTAFTQSQTFYNWGSIGVASSGGALNSTITPPSDNPIIGNLSANANVPTIILEP